MAWWTYRQYRLWVINIQQEAFLYKWENWQHLMPAVGKLLAITHEQPFIQSSQAYEFENKWLGFGRMKWSFENNQKWTTKYYSEGNTRKVLFFSTSIWAPDWIQCEKRAVPPDVYVKLYNFPGARVARQGLIIAIPKRAVSKNKDIVESQLLTLKQLIPGSTLSLVTRLWQPWFRFDNHVQDINPQELEKIINDPKNAHLS